MRHFVVFMSLSVLAAFLVSCQSPTSSLPQPPAPPPPAAGSIVLKNESPDGLTLSAYAPPGTGPAVATAPKVPAGQTAALTVVPVSQDLLFKVKSDAEPPVNYSLTTDGESAVFHLSPLRAYNLDFFMDDSEPAELVYSWLLAANPAYEVSNLKVVAATNSLKLTWNDPTLADFASVVVKVAGKPPATVAKGAQTLTISGLTGGATVNVTVEAVYPEITSRGVKISGTPLAPTEVKAPSIYYNTPSQGETSVYAVPGTIKVYYTNSAAAAVDPATVDSSTFLVSDGTSFVAGTTEVSGGTITFTPTTALTPGKTHTVTLTTGVKSLSGAALGAPYSWSFTTAAAVVPTITSTTPYKGILNVNVAPGTVKVTFGGMMYKPSLNASTFVVSDEDGPVAGTLNVTNSDATFSPAAALHYGTVYTVALKSGIYSTTGGGLPPQEWTFTTKYPSLFQPKQLLATSASVQAAALGDVTGDGKPDLIGLTGPSGSSDLSQAQKLVVFPQTEQGWGEPTFYFGTSSGGYSLSSLAVGDLDGDGKAEVLVARTTGIMIYKQNGSGGLTWSGELESTDSYSIRIAQLNNDTLPDIAGIGFNTNTVSVWLQKSDRTFDQAAQTYSAPHGGYDSLAVGDLNSDGRTDLVVRSGQSNDANLQVLTQKASGTFNSAVSYSVDPDTAILPKGLVVGDLTGDGKDDLVVSFGGNSGKLGVFVQNGTALSTTMSPSTSTYDIPGALELADFNGDGRKDLLVFHQMFLSVGVHLQRNDGTLDPVEYLSDVGDNQAFGPAPMMTGDLNNDTKADVVVATDDGLVILYGK